MTLAAKPLRTFLPGGRDWDGSKPWVQRIAFVWGPSDELWRIVQG